MAEVPELLRAKLEAYGARRRLVGLGRAGAEVLLLWLCGMLLVALIDFALRPARSWQVSSCCAVYVVALGMLVWRGIVPALRRRRLVDLALGLERGLGGRLEERVSSAVELAVGQDTGVSPWMINRTVSLAVADLAGIDIGSVVERATLRRAWRRVGGPAVLAVLMLILPVVRGYMLRAILPGINLARPCGVDFVVEPGDLRLAAGRPLRIRMHSDPPQQAAVLVIDWQDGVSEELAMKAGEAGGVFELTVPDMMQDLSYRVRSGAAESRAYDVRVVEPPRLKALALRVTPPDYLGNRIKQIQGGDADLLAGSVVELSAELSGPRAAAAELLMGSGERRAMLISGKRAGVRLTVMRSLHYRIRLTGDDGLTADAAGQWNLKVVPDGKPQAELSGLGLDAGLVGAGEHMVLSARASDDWGLAGCELLMNVGQGQERKVASFSPAKRGELELRHTATVDLAALGVRAGQSIRLILRVRDLGGQESCSKALSLAVVDGAPAGTAAAAARLRRLLGRMKQLEADLKRERRVWAELSRSFRREDVEAQRGTVVVARQRLAAIFKSAASLGADVAQESGRLDAKLGSRVFRYAADLREWVRSRGAMIARTTRRPDSAETSEQPLLAALELVGTSARELAAARARLGLITARVEAEGLVLQASAAGKRAERVLPVLEGYFGWRRQQMRKRPGLRAQFYRGRGLAGKPVHTAAGAVNSSNFKVPGVGLNEWSVRWTGEVHIPKAGKWTFSCRADDGVRLWVAGRELIGSKAWVTQSPTSYSGIINLPAGWHQVEIRSFQGTGGSHLSFYRAAGGSKAQLVPLSELRHLPEDASERQELIAKMSSIPSGVLKTAGGSLTRDCKVLAGVPGTIRRMNRDARVKYLVGIASAADTPSRELRRRTKRADASGWGAVRLDEVGVQSAALVARAVQARDTVEKAMYYAFDGRRPPGGLTLELVRGMERIRKRSAALVSLGKGMRDADRRALLRRSLSAMALEVEQLRLAVRSVRRRLHSRAAERVRGLGERQHALTAGNRLGDEIEDAIARIARALQAHGGKPAESAALDGAVRRQLSIMSPHVEHAGRDEAKSNQARAARLAAGVLLEAGQTAAHREAGNALEAAEARAQLEKHLIALAAEERRAGSFAGALRTDSELKTSRGAGLSRAASGALANLARRTNEVEWRVGKALENEASRMVTRKPASAELGERLAVAALQVELTGDSQEWRGRSVEAAAYREVSADLGALSRRQKPASVSEVKALAARIAAIESRLGAKARNDALDEGREYAKKRAGQDERWAAAEKLKRLARQVGDGARNSSKRKDVRDRLAQLSKAGALDGQVAARLSLQKSAALAEMAKGAEEAAKRLAQLEKRLGEVEQRDAQARARFATVEKMVAEALGKLRGDARQGSSQLSGKALGKELGRLAEKLPERVRRIAELGKMAEGAAREAAATSAKKGDDASGRADARKALELAAGASKAATEAGRQAAAREKSEREKQVGARQAEATELKRARGDATELAREAGAVRAALGKRPPKAATRALAEVEGQAQKALAAAKNAARAAGKAREMAGLAEGARALERAMKDVAEIAREEKRSEQDKAMLSAAKRRAAMQAGALQKVADDVAGRSSKRIASLKKQSEELTRKAAQSPKKGLTQALERKAKAIGHNLADALADQAVAAQAKRTADAARKALAAMDRAGKTAAKKQDGSADPATAFAQAAAAKAQALRRSLEGREAVAEAQKRSMLNEAQAALDAAAKAAQTAAAAERSRRKPMAADAAARLAAKAGESARRMAAVRKTAEQGAQQFAARIRPIRTAEQLAREAMAEARKARKAAREAGEQMAGQLAQPQETEQRSHIPKQSAGQFAKGRRKTEEALDRAGKAARLAGRAAELLKPDAKGTVATEAAQEEWQAARERAAGAGAEASAAKREAERLGRNADARKTEARNAATRAGSALVAAKRAKPGQDKIAAQARAAVAVKDALAKATQAGAAAGQAQAAAARADAAKAAATISQATALAKGQRAAAQASEVALKQQAAREGTVSSRELAKAAGVEAKQLRKKLAEPLAEAYKIGGAKGSAPEQARMAARTGEKLAGLVARQEAAASELAGNQASREKLERELAAELDQASQQARSTREALAGGRLAEAAPAGGDPGKLQEAANSAQRAADAAQARANSARQGAARQAAKRDAAAAGSQGRAALDAAAQKANAAQAGAHQRAVAAQADALKQQAVASAAHQSGMAMAAGGGSQGKLRAAEALGNLEKAEANSAAASSNLASGKSSAEKGAAAQAAANARAARAARSQLVASQRGGASGLKQELDSLAGRARQAGSAAKAAGAMQSGQGAGQRGKPGEASARGAAGAAVQDALSTVNAAPASAAAYQRAAGQLAAAAAQLSAQAGAPGQSSAKGGPGSASAQSSNSNSGQGSSASSDPGDMSGFEKRRRGEDGAGWARLSDSLRRNIRSGGLTDFAEEHQEAIRAYFRKLAEAGKE
jgi:PA14 domain